MSTILVDTSVIVDFLRRKDTESSPYVSLLKQGYDPSISIVTHTELYSGKSVWERAYLREMLQNVLSGIDLYPYNVSISEEAGKLRATYHLEFVDAIIAATAITRHLPLATLNRKDFEKVKELKLVYFH